MYDVKRIKERLNHILGEVIGSKRDLITLDLKDKNKSESAWADLVSAIPEITRLWKGQGAVTEIKSQRRREHNENIKRNN